MTDRAAELLRQLARGIDRLEVPFGSASMEALYGAVTATGLRRLLRDGSITVDEVGRRLDAQDLCRHRATLVTAEIGLTVAALLIAPLPNLPDGSQSHHRGSCRSRHQSTVMSLLIRAAAAAATTS